MKSKLNNIKNYLYKIFAIIVLNNEANNILINISFYFN